MGLEVERCGGAVGLVTYVAAGAVEVSLVLRSSKKALYGCGYIHRQHEESQPYTKLRLQNAVNVKPENNATIKGRHPDQPNCTQPTTPHATNTDAYCIAAITSTTPALPQYTPAIAVSTATTSTSTYAHSGHCTGPHAVS